MNNTTWKWIGEVVLSVFAIILTVIAALGAVVYYVVIPFCGWCADTFSFWRITLKEADLHEFCD